MFPPRCAAKWLCTSLLSSMQCGALEVWWWYSCWCPCMNVDPLATLMWRERRFPTIFLHSVLLKNSKIIFPRKGKNNMWEIFSFHFSISNWSLSCALKRAHKHAHAHTWTHTYTHKLQLQLLVGMYDKLVCNTCSLRMAGGMAYSPKMNNIFFGNW